MNSALEDVILGIISNGLTALIAYFSRKSGTLLVGEDFLKKIKEKQTALQPILQKAADAVAEGIEWKGPSRLEEICLFLASPEAEAIVRQIYSAKLSPNKGVDSLKSIQKEFLAALSLYTGVEENKLAEPAILLIDALIEGCEQALNVAINEGTLSAHEAKSSFRYRLILDEIAAIQKNLTFLTAQQGLNVKAILEFEKKFRDQVGGRHSHIIPPHFDVARKIPIDNLYVCPNFVKTLEKKGQRAEVLNVLEFLSVMYRSVLLGNPGSGKSTFALKVCYDLAIYYTDRLMARRQVTPILVVLRDYGAEKKNRNCSILQFIETTSNSKYQVSPSPSAFEYLLLNGRVAVIFDGLDELLETSYRQEISSDIESFCALYPSVPVLVTSREVGYEQAPLDDKKFEVFHLDDFNENQVEEYVRKWFAADYDLLPDQQKQKANSFIDESRTVPDLRSNPLMLALLCNIYRGENYIPRNRPDVYEKCAMMLFERWDKSRGIYVPLPFEAHIRPAMMYLAHWIYADESLQGGVTEENLVAKATEYLSPRRFEDRDEAEKAACEFIEFCRGRAWVFSDTGTTKEGERLYQFTHRTFLEYFTSAHLVRTHPTPDRLGEALLPKISKREWDVVSQLAFQLQNKNVEGAGDELLSMLIRQAHESENDIKWNLLSFSARCLGFMVPSPKMAQDITTDCIEQCMLWGFSRQIRKRKYQKRVPGIYSPDRLLYDLLNSTNENRATIGNRVEKLLIGRANSKNIGEALLALEIGLNLTKTLLAEPRPWMLQPELMDFWSVVSDHIFNACYNRVETMCPRHFGVCLDVVWRREDFIANLCKWHGLESLFRDRRFRIISGNWPSIASVLVYLILAPGLIGGGGVSYLIGARKGRSIDWPYYLNEVGRILFSFPPPWLKRERPFEPNIIPLILHIDRHEPLHLDSGPLFGAFILLALALEGLEKQKEFPALIEKFKKSQTSLFNSFRWTFLSRFEQVETDKVQAEIENVGFTKEQQAFAWRWAQRQIDLVQIQIYKDKNIE